MIKNKKQIYSQNRFVFCLYIKGAKYSRKINSIYMTERLRLFCYGLGFSIRYTSLDDVPGEKSGLPGNDDGRSKKSFEQKSLR